MDLPVQRNPLIPKNSMTICSNERNLCLMFPPLYPYQKRVLKALMRGENIILVIPTGGGKTIAASLPFFHNRAHEYGRLPEKALYTVPMRVLATQFHSTCTDLYKNTLNPDLFQKIEALYRSFGQETISLQTGESPQDPQFEAMITACTIDQLLASGLGVPYTLGFKKANINVAAVCSSYLILDEPHLYPLSNEGRSYKGAFTTCLELLRLMKGLTRFVFMSATMSRPLVQRLSKLLAATIITVDDDELAQLNKGRSRIFERAEQPMNAQHILQAHDRCSLVVCNTVQRAQETYLQLSELIKQQERAIELRLLHSRFTDADRKRQGQELSQLLGKEQWQDGAYQGRNIIVVATQVVEVGLDISVQTLHTELAPANSLVQRAGRCARFERQQGRVLVYPLASDEEGKPASTLPYASALCESTWQALARFSGQVVGFREEQELVDIVHTADDLALLERYEEHRSEIQQAITSSLCTADRASVGDLIRDVTQVQVFIHNDPGTAMTTKPWRWQSFGLHASALMGKHWQRLKARQSELDCACPKKACLNQQERADDDEDSRLPTVYNWQPITHESEIPATLMIALPNQLATYDQDLGFVFLDGRLALPESWLQRLRQQNYQSEFRPNANDKPEDSPTRMQRYEQHIGGLADAYHYAIRHEIAYVSKRLEDLMALAPGTIDHAIQLAIATHDLGKLDAKWQRWARAWQHLLYTKGQWTSPYREPDRSFFFAKTNYDFRSKEQYEWKQELREKRPHHACESVVAGRRLILHSLGINSPHSPNIPVARAVCSAIAHHHTPTAHEYGKTEISPIARTAIQNALEAVRRGGHWSYDLDRLTLTFEKGDLRPVNIEENPRLTEPRLAAGPEKLLETWLAFLVVRALRLADQRADLYAI
jgi:CRISPR-associated endonuclease/helicase Cas3